MRKNKSRDQYIVDECAYFLDELQYAVEQRNKTDFEYMMADAKDMAKFVNDLMIKLTERGD